MIVLFCPVLCPGVRRVKGGVIGQNGENRSEVEAGEQLRAFKGGNARWAVGKVMRGGNGRFRAEVAGDPPAGERNRIG